MARIGAFCFPGTGHLNPMTALARRLQQRGHSVVIFGTADTEARIRAAGIEFSLIGQADYPLGTLDKLDRRLSELKGLKSFQFTEKKYVEFRASASNALNRALLAGPDTNMNDATFGKIVQPQFNSPRSVQMGLKLYF